MWQSVNGYVLTNQIDIRSEKTHEMTRCKWVQRVMKGQTTFSETLAEVFLLHMIEDNVSIHSF